MASQFSGLYCVNDANVEAVKIDFKSDLTYQYHFIHGFGLTFWIQVFSLCHALLCPSFPSNSYLWEAHLYHVHPMVDHDYLLSLTNRCDNSSIILGKSIDNS